MLSRLELITKLWADDPDSCISTFFSPDDNAVVLVDCQPLGCRSLGSLHRLVLQQCPQSNAVINNAFVAAGEYKFRGDTIHYREYPTKVFGLTFFYIARIHHSRRSKWNIVFSKGVWTFQYTVLALGPVDKTLRMNDLRDLSWRILLP